MNRQTAIDFSTTTTAIAYQDRDGAHAGEVRLVKFDGNDYVPTVVLKEGTITNKKGIDIHHEEAFGWEASAKKSAHSLLQTHFKMDLISKDPALQANAQTLTRKFFCYLYEQYSQNVVLPKDARLAKETTVVTHPAKFPPEVREFLKKAAEDAGFQNVTLLEESKAAMAFSLNYDTPETRQFFNHRQGKKLKVTLIDMGAGTTDIAVFEYDTADPTQFQHLCSWPETGGNNFGGSEIDEALCSFYLEKLGSSIPKILGQGNSTLGEVLLRSQVKRFKETTVSADLNRGEEITDLPSDLVPIAYSLPDTPDTDLDRAAFEALLKDYLPQFPKLVKGALDKAGISGKDVDLVLLTGGHSQWYFVKEMLAQLEIQKDAILSFPDPHLVVAQGAALYTEPKKQETPSHDAPDPGSDQTKQHKSKSAQDPQDKLSLADKVAITAAAAAATASAYSKYKKQQILLDSASKQSPPKKTGSIFPLTYDPKSLIRPVIASGNNFILAVEQNGRVLAAGETGSISQVFLWRDIVSVAAGSHHAVGLRSDGTVVTAGVSSYGSCNVSDWKNIVAIAAGPDSTAGLRADGTVVFTGLTKRTKKIVEGWSSIASIAISRHDNTVWGLRKNGELFKCEELFKSDTDYRFIPDAKMVCSQDRNTFAVATYSGKVNYYSPGTKTHPTQQWGHIKAIDMDYQTVGLKIDGTVVAIESSNHNGQVSHWRNIIAVAAGYYWTIGLKQDGTMVIAYKKGFLDPKSPAEEISKWKLF